AHYPTKERAEEAVKLRLEEWARQYSGGHPEGLEFFVLHDPQSPEKFQWSVRGRTKLSEVKACYLNIRKPYNMDTSMSEQDAQTLWGALPGQRFESFRKAFSGYFRGKAGMEAFQATGNDVYEVLRARGLSQADNPRTAVNSFLQSQGYDGLVHLGGRILGNKEHRVWIAFNPEQIKAVDNRGTFDPKDSNMFKAVRGLFLLCKAHVRGHHRRGPQGQMEFVHDYENKVQPQQEDFGGGFARRLWIAKPIRSEKPQRGIEGLPLFNQAAMEHERKQE